MIDLDDLEHVECPFCGATCHVSVWPAFGWTFRGWKFVHPGRSWSAAEWCTVPVLQWPWVRFLRWLIQDSPGFH